MVLCRGCGVHCCGGMFLCWRHLCQGVDRHKVQNPCFNDGFSTYFQNLQSPARESTTTVKPNKMTSAKAETWAAKDPPKLCKGQLGLQSLEGSDLMFGDAWRCLAQVLIASWNGLGERRRNSSQNSSSGLGRCRRAWTWKRSIRTDKSHDSSRQRSQMFSDILRCSQMFSDVLRCSQMFSAFHTFLIC